MIPSEADMQTIAAICDRASFHEEGAKHLIYMEGLRFIVGDLPRSTEALLWLNNPNPTYPTKLLLPAKIEYPNINWNETAYILGKSWDTFSWRDVPAGQSPFKILADHLSAFRQKSAA